MLSHDLADKYLADFAAAENPKQVQPHHAPLALKLLEEAIEAAFAAGYSFEIIEGMAASVIFRERMKLVHTPAEVGLEATMEELADCAIVVQTMAGLLEQRVTARLDIAITAKLATNRKRLWRVNEFGALSNRGLRP